MKLTSTAFAHEGEIPAKYTCEGLDISPPLAWSDLPEGTHSLALIVDDPDAPDPAAPKMCYVHWVVYNISPDQAGLAEEVQGLNEGMNDFGRTNYGGPCPPIGRHRYFFKLYALSTELAGLSTPTKKELEQAIQGLILEEAVLMGTYQKQ